MMSNADMLSVKGGTINGTVLNAISRIFTTVLEIGRAIGSSISIAKSGNKC
jgi:hypothetical protein